MDYPLSSSIADLCLQLPLSSDLLLSDPNSGWNKMKNFSLTHKLHILLTGEKVAALHMIFHLIVYSLFLSLSVQIYCASLQDFSRLLFLILALWLVYLVLNVVLVSPIYVSSLVFSPSWLETVAWDTKLVKKYSNSKQKRILSSFD